ncbi:hypothetical protein B566_EDAN008571 [Ephemera danica]|nr:hypothetical protein B566_EDAN008571 [Ephemera danica]
MECFGEDELPLREALEEIYRALLRVYCWQECVLRVFSESDQTVTVRRGDGEFGFRIHGSRPVVVSAIEPATPAESSGLEVGDIVISVNGVNVLDASHSEVVKLAHAGSEVLQLEVASTRNVLGSGEADTMDEDGDDEGPAASVERCGHLMKRSPASGKWLRRWFVLRADGCLYCYKSPALECRPLGALCLSQYSVSSPDPGNMSSDPVAEPRWLLRLSRDGALALTLAADSQGERDDWVASLHSAATCPLKWEERLAQGGRLALAPADIAQPDCFGFLHKLGRRWRAWTRLYCVLKDACLFLFTAPDSPRASGLLCLHGYRIQGASAGGKRFAFDALAPDPKQRHYYFHADSELDKKRWMAALEYSIDRWLKIA